MLAFDLPPPAIVQVRPALDLRLNLNGEDGASGLPRDFLAMPPLLRATVPLAEIRRWLPAEFRRIPGDLLSDLVYAVVAGLPGAHMAGAIKKAWLYTAPGQFLVPGDWNKRDNVIHALGCGGNGQGAQRASLGGNYGGGGGGGGAWSVFYNYVLTKHDFLDVSPGQPTEVIMAPIESDNPDDTWFINATTLLAPSGKSGDALESGESKGGNGGSASIYSHASNAGAKGDNTNDELGGEGGGAGGKNGPGIGQSADGGVDYDTSWLDPKVSAKVNARPGYGGAGGGFSGRLAGDPGHEYGGGGGGGGVDGGYFLGGQGSTGIILIINNLSK